MTRNAVEVAPRPGRTVTAVAWKTGTRRLAIGWDDGCVQVAAADEPISVRPLREGGRGAITSISWHPDGTRLAFGSAAGECGATRADA